MCRTFASDSHRKPIENITSKRQVFAKEEFYAVIRFIQADLVT